MCLVQKDIYCFFLFWVFWHDGACSWEFIKFKFLTSKSFKKNILFTHEDKRVSGRCCLSDNLQRITKFPTKIPPFWNLVQLTSLHSVSTWPYYITLLSNPTKETNCDGVLVWIFNKSINRVDISLTRGSYYCQIGFTFL